MGDDIEYEDSITTGAGEPNVDTWVHTPVLGRSSLRIGRRIVLRVQNLSDPQESCSAHLTAENARRLAAILTRHADLLDSK